MSFIKTDGHGSGGHRKWAEFRFSVIGHLLAAPPEKGEVKKCMDALAAKTWRHPITGEPMRLGSSTIERWFYMTRKRPDPVESLKRKVRFDAGSMPAMGEQRISILNQQYRDHPSWSYQLHTDNFSVLIREKEPDMLAPSYSTVKRYMKRHGLLRKKKSRNHLRPAAIEAFERSQRRETRLFEAPYPQSLWHLDFHDGSRQLLGENGKWFTPQCLCILDDHSRLACHIQWYEHENTDCLVHGYTQALQKRGLPREQMSDNGSAMKSEEFTKGLSRLGIIFSPTLEYSPNQNGKQEVFWGSLEGRLMAMLENVKDLSLKALNDATLAWVEMEYNRRVHSETKETPLQRFLRGQDVSRPCPDQEFLKDAFTSEVTRTQRQSDGTIQIEGRRFEIPSRYRHMEKLCIRYARWDLSRLYLADEGGKRIIAIYPVDLIKNATSGRRAMETDIFKADDGVKRSTDMAPLLKKLMAQYAATGMPPAYIPKSASFDNEESDA